MLADRIGRKQIVLISLAGFIVTNLVLATVNIPLVFILVRFVEGMIISGLMPASMAMVGEVFPQKLLIILGSLLYSSLNVGMLFLHQYGLLIEAAMATGIGNAPLIPALSTIYLSATAEQNRSHVMGIRGTAISLATLLSLLAQALTRPWITPQLTFAIAVALSLVITLLVFVVLKR